MRRRTDAAPANAATLREELELLREQNAVIENSPVTTGVVTADAFDSLTPTEQAAGSLGVHPDAWKPIAFMNSAVRQPPKPVAALLLLPPLTLVRLCHLCHCFLTLCIHLAAF